MDVVEEWTQAQTRVIALTEHLTPHDAAATVPATPEWSVRDLLAHMVGLGADVLAGDEPDDHNESWTWQQVRSRADHDISRLLAEWRAITGPMRAYLAGTSPRPLGDAVIHEQDLRGALGEPGARDNAGLASLRDRMAGRVGARIADAGLAPLRLEGTDWSLGPDDAEVVVRASTFDLTRAVLSRRSATQLVSWTVRGDVTPYLAHFAVLGALPARDLDE